MSALAATEQRRHRECVIKNDRCFVRKVTGKGGNNAGHAIGQQASHMSAARGGLNFARENSAADDQTVKGE